MTQPDVFALYAVRYAHNAHRKRGHTFLVKQPGGDIRVAHNSGTGV